MSQWLDRPGAPMLRIDWWSIDRGGGIEIGVEQLQPGEPFEIPLTVAVTLKDGSVARHVLDLSSQSQRFTLPTVSRPMSLQIDPDNDVLLWRPEYGPRPENGPQPASK
jgi:aminopeptidase N